MEEARDLAIKALNGLAVHEAVCTQRYQALEAAQLGQSIRLQNMESRVLTVIGVFMAIQTSIIGYLLTKYVL